MLDFNAVAVGQSFAGPIRATDQSIIQADADALNGQAEFSEQFRQLCRSNLPLRSVE